MQKIWLTAALLTAAAAAQAQEGNPYAEDLLRAAKPKIDVAECPKVETLQFTEQASVTEQQAAALLCNAAKEPSMLPQMLEYGCTERSELLIATMLDWGVPYDAIGRASTFFDTANNGGGHNVFVLEDPYHGRAFNRAWQLVFGNAFPLRIELRGTQQTTVLDVDGTIRWNIGHIAPTLWVVDGQGRRSQRVLDPVLSPDAPLSLDAWRALQKAQPAAIAWGALGEAPQLQVESLSGEMLERFRKVQHMPAHEPVDAAYWNKMLADVPQDVRADVYAEVLNIPRKAAWHPREWAGYSFAGDDLPDWRPQDGRLGQRRYAAAKERMALLRAYVEMRESFKDEEAFLEAVREGMREGGKDPKVVFIDFSEDY
jgi:hypothetical protein